MLECTNLEIHVTSTSNLFCESYSHLSDHNIGENVPFEQLAEEMGQWSGRIKPEVFSILGDEPTFHKELPRIVRECRNHWPFSDLQLVTNGFFLHNHHDLPATLERTKCKLDISSYGSDAESMQKEASIKKLIASWKEKYNFRVAFRSSPTPWHKAFQGTTHEMMPWHNNEAEKSYDICVAKHRPQISQGKIYKCPQLAYLNSMKEKYKLDKSWDQYLSYRPLYPTCSDEELVEFFSKKVEPYCTMCPS